MMGTYLVIGFTLVIFIAIIANIAKNQQSNSSGTITGVAAVIASFGGVIIYGVAYSDILDNGILMVVKSLIATLGMYLGRNEYNDIKEAAIMSYDYVIIAFWTVHLLALYATTNAVLATIGAQALKRIRMYIRKLKKKIVIIYGVNKHSISFGSELSNTRDSHIIYVDRHIEADLMPSLNECGCLYFITKDAVEASEKFLKNIGLKKNKQIAIYTLSDNESENFDFAVAIKKSFEEFGMDTANTSLTLIANMEMKYGEALQAYDGLYGFGSVMVLDKAYLTAHALVDKYPPCNYVAFDTKTARAQKGEVFTAAIIGFGKIGQAVLKSLVINGQFEGCGFNVTVFDPKHPDISGYLYKNSESMMKNYEINLLTDNAQEKNFYEYIEKNCSVLDYIVVCTGDVEKNAEITGDIQSTLVRFDGHADVFQCTYDNIIHLHKVDGGESRLQITNLYTRKNIDIAYADNMAMQINHVYCGGDSAQSDWSKARFLDKMSCRASADFATAFLKMTGLSKEDVLDNNKWDELSKEQLLNLSKTEHLRWCAFHYSHGYTQMPEEMFEERCRAYKEEVEKLGSSKIRIQKDENKFTHICLVDWDELDELSEKYKEVTGATNKDYKQDDTNNVLMFKKVLAATEAGPV